MYPSPAPLDAATSHTILLIALYLLAALGGVLAWVYEARFAVAGLAISLAAGAIALVTTALQQPLLVPIVVVGLVCTALAGRSLARERSQR